MVALSPPSYHTRSSSTSSLHCNDQQYYRNAPILTDIANRRNKADLRILPTETWSGRLKAWTYHLSHIPRVLRNNSDHRDTRYQLHLDTLARSRNSPNRHHSNS